MLLLPWALVLLAPAALLWWHWARHGHGRWWRAAVLLLLVLAAAWPRLVLGRGGSDVVLVLDRSASMEGARDRQEALLRLAGDQRRTDDRLAVVAFGERPRVLQGPQATGLPALSGIEVDEDGSDLAAALESASALLAPGRSARVVVVSDGEHTGPAPRLAAARLAMQGVPVDTLAESRPPLADAAVIDLELPAQLRLGESFIGAARLVSDRAERRAWQVERNGAVIAHGEADLLPGRPLAVTFADRPGTAGVAAYAVVLDPRDDARPANNRAQGALRIAGGERVLVVGEGAAHGNLLAALRAAGIAATAREPGPLALADLVGCSCLVLEQVRADAVGATGHEAVARWVEHLGGGLVMTGGRRGFGAGGWHRSAVERVLPVTMEIRDEHRKLSVCMAIAVDRSGSMACPSADGRPKMDLANEGVAAAIELLGPRDQVAVFAVDSAPHEIIPLTEVGDGRRLAREVLGMRSEGGGIFVHAALVAAGEAAARGSAGTRHVVLFADAADSEEPGDYQGLIAGFRKAGITVSVVAMGSERDCDANLLKDIAALGGGRIAFAERAEDIPRLFAQETLLVARSAWVDQAVALLPRPSLPAVLGSGWAGAAGWPGVPGYNLTYARERAQVLGWCPGDPQAPALAAWRIGGGRAAAVCFDVDDAKAPALMAWDGYGSLLAGLVRWCAGSGDEAPATLVAERRGRSALLRLDADPARVTEGMPAPVLALARDGEFGAPRLLPMAQVDRHRYEAAVPVDARAPLLPACTIGGQAVVGPALLLPMSPESAPRHGLEAGAAVLAAVSAATRGSPRRDLVGVFANPPSPGRPVELALPLAIAALALVAIEIAVRRLRLGLPRLPPGSLLAPLRALRRGWARLRPAPDIVIEPAPAGQPDQPDAASDPIARDPAPAAPASPPTGPAPPPPLPPTGPREGLHEALKNLRRR